MTAPSRPSRTTYRHGDLRNALLHEAALMLRESGPEEFTLRGAARRVGVNHGAVYRHFGDKRALLAVVAERGHAGLVATIARALASAGEEPADRLRAVASHYVRYALADPSRYELMFDARLNADGRFPTLEAQAEESMSMLQGELRRGAAAGAFRAGREKDDAVALWSALHGLAGLLLARRVRLRRSAVEAWTGEIVGRTVAGLARS